MSNENKPMEVILKETPDIDISFETVVYQGNNVGVLKNNSINNYAQQLINGTLKFCGVTRNGTDSIILYDKDNNQFLIIKSNSSQFGKYNSETVLVSSSADLIHNRSGEGNFPVWDSFNLPISTVNDLKSLITDAVKKPDLLDSVKVAGINTANGYFNKNNAALSLSGSSKSIAILLTTGSDVSTLQYVFQQSENAIAIIQNNQLGAFYTTKLTITPNTTYLLVVVFNPSKTQPISTYINGNYIGSGTGSATDNNRIFTLGANSSGISPLLGDIHMCRIFNYPLAEHEISEMWNNGNPAGYTLPNSFTNINISNRYSFMAPMSLDGWIEKPGTDISPIIEDDAIKCAFNSPAVQSYKNGIYRNIGSFTKNKRIMMKCKMKSSVAGNIVSIGLAANGGTSPYGAKSFGLTTEWKEYVIDVVNNYAALLDTIIFYPAFNTDQTGFFYIKDVEVVEVGCAAEYLPGNITTSQWIDSAGNNLDLTASGTPQLVNYNIYPTYYATKEDLETEIKLKSKRNIITAGNNISNNQLMVINDESSITISCDNLEDGATADIRAKGNTIITFTDSNRQIRYIKSYDTIDAASTDIVIYSLMCSNDEVYITRAIF